MSKLSAWMKKYERPFSIEAKNGRGTIQIEFHDGYVTISGTQPGHRQYQTRIHVTRRAWLQLLRQALRPTRLMEGPSFDPYRAEREYFRQEQEHLEELRRQKRERKRPRRRRS